MTTAKKIYSAKGRYKERKYDRVGAKANAETRMRIKKQAERQGSSDEQTYEMHV